MKITIEGNGYKFELEGDPDILGEAIELCYTSDIVNCDSQIIPEEIILRTLRAFRRLNFFPELESGIDDYNDYLFEMDKSLDDDDVSIITFAKYIIQERTLD
jgi:hypothetical protein